MAYRSHVFAALKDWRVSVFITANLAKLIATNFTGVCSWFVPGWVADPSADVLLFIQVLFTSV
jgi:hypothetical protein